MTVSRKLCTWALGAAILGGSIAAVAAKDGLNIRMRDDCDPATFNAVLGKDACVGSGDTTFAKFQEEFGEEGEVGAWKFNNDRADVNRGTAITLTNRGGETHTFTRVAEFGGGFVPPLNARPDGTTLAPAPECAVAPGVPQAPGPDNIFLPAGASTVGPTITTRRTVKFQCCIHPWMHAEITGK
jgi:plastocyanin